MYVFQAYTSFFPTFLREYHELAPGRASALFGLGYLLIAVFLPIVGTLADRYGADAGLFVPYVTTGAGIALLLVPSAGPPVAGVDATVVGGVVVLGVGLTWGGALQARAMAGFPTDRQAAGFGLMRTAFVLLGSVGNVATGALAARAGWQVAYGVPVVLLAVAAAAVAGNRALGTGL
jgi:MFS family permease